MIGALADAAGVFGDPAVTRALDLAAYGKTGEGKDVLPFLPEYPNNQETTHGRLAVKTLEWRAFDKHLTARAVPVGIYAIIVGISFEVRLDGNTVGKFGSYEEAKAAAQADYEMRIRSALSPAATSGSEAGGGDVREDRE